MPSNIKALKVILISAVVLLLGAANQTLSSPTRASPTPVLISSLVTSAWLRV